MPKISIIVPVYNAEKVLSRCIKSILNQSFKDFELILINDGSSDRSIDILKKFEKLDERIRVIDNSNNGVSETRNIGIKEAIGEYIQFIDSDDFIESNMLEETLNIMENKEADLVMTGFFLDIEEKNKIVTEIQTYENNISNNKKDIAINVLERLSGTYVNSPVNKLYKRSVIIDNNLFMDKNIDLGEDLAFNLEYLKYCNCVVFSEKCYYHYCMRLEDNLTFKYRKDKLELMEALYKNCISYFEASDLERSHIRKMNGLFIKWMYSCYIDLHNRNCDLSISGKYKFIKESIKKYNNIINDTDDLSFAFKLLKLSLAFPISVILLSKIIYFIKVNMRKVFYR